MNNTVVKQVSFGNQDINKQIQNLPPQKTSVQQPVNLKPQFDTVELSKQDKNIAENSENVKPKRKGIIERFANFVGSIKKFGVNVAEYTKGGAKGIAGFAVGTAAGTGSVFVLHKVKQGLKIAKENGKGKFGTVISNLMTGIARNLNPQNLKNTLKTPKGLLAVAAGIGVGAIAFMINVYKAKLAVNQKSADLDHKYYQKPHTV